MRNRITQIRQRLTSSRRVVTLEINSTSLRLMEVKGTMVTKWASRLLDPAMFENEVPANPRTLSLAIRQLLASNGVKTKKISIGISGLFSLSRIVSVPASSTGGAALQRTVLDKAKEVLPISEDELYLSWQIIADTDDERRALIIGVPRNLIDSEVQALKAAGTTPHILEIKAMALIRVVNREQALILNIEPATIEVVLVADGLPQSIRTSAWQTTSMSLEDMAEYLAVALELTAGAYNSSRPGAELDSATPLFITGGMSGDAELVAAVRARMAYPLEELSPLLECPPHLPASQYAVNIGLASRDIAV